MPVRRKLVFAAVAFLLMSGLAYGLVIWMLPKDGPRNASFLSDGHLWYCYSSDEQDAFPVDLASSEADRRRLSRQLSRQDVDRAMRHTPHCVALDYQARQVGRDPDRPVTVALVGDSFTAGLGVANAGTLGFLLNDAYPAVNFLNWGGVNADVEGVSEQLLQITDPASLAPEERGRLKAVIYFYNLNDLADQTELSITVPTWYMNSGDGHWRNPGRQVTGWQRLIPGLPRLLTVVRSRHEQSEVTEKEFLKAYDPVRGKGSLDKTFRIIGAMKQKVEKLGLRFYLVIYPLLHTSSSGEYPFEPIHRLLLQRCAAAGLACIDGAPALSSVWFITRYHVHPSDPHPNAAANRLLVEHLVSSKKLDFR